MTKIVWALLLTIPENTLNTFVYCHFGIIHWFKQIHKKSLKMRLKSKAKSNIGLCNFKTTSELSVAKKWKNDGILYKTSFS